MIKSIRISGDHWERLIGALLIPDGKEAVAFALCGISTRDRIVYTVRDVITLAASDYLERRTERVTWKTDVLVPVLDRAARERLAVMKIHAHPGGEDFFSNLDNVSDGSLRASLDAWCGDVPYLSGVIFPDKRLRAREFRGGEPETIAGIDIIGDDLTFYERGQVDDTPDFGTRVEQVFGKRTYSLLGSLRVAVVGCSGTGSLVIEQLARNGVGELLLVDPDTVEPKNLNRIVNTTAQDADRRRLKVEVLKDAIEEMGLGTKVEAFPLNLFKPAAVRAVSSADVVFGCVDTVDTRHLLNQLASFYVLPYFDLGVRLEADAAGGIEQVCGGVHYLRPDGGSLLTRRMYTLEDVRAAGLRRTDPAAYEERRRANYVHGVEEDRPAVISVNMLIASLAVNDFLARIHPYRLEASASYSIQYVSLSHDIFEHHADRTTCPVVGRNLGRGDVTPLLNNPELSD